MKSTRRMKRMARNHSKKIPGMSLTSLMDVFTILVFFLLVNSGSEVLEPPKKITLPDSVVETKPRETATIVVSDEGVIVQGEMVTTMAEVVAAQGETIAPVTERLQAIKGAVIGASTKAVAESTEVTILSHKTIPFKVLRKIMSSCTYAGYDKISLAVLQKAKQG